jgi:NhaP-type Na+/H+ or K+/H+ antiporter
MAGAVLAFNEQIERILEVALVLIIGMALTWASFRLETAAFIAVLFLAIRPAAVLVGLLGSQSTGRERVLTSWFGIRGIGSLYYLMYAVNHGLSHALGQELVPTTLMVIAVSVLVHGITVTPLMTWYQMRSGRSGVL